MLIGKGKKKNGFHFTHDRVIHKGEKKMAAKGSFANFNIFQSFTFLLIEGNLIGATHPDRHNLGHTDRLVCHGFYGYLILNLE
jgi:hypothetical protein